MTERDETTTLVSLWAAVTNAELDAIAAAGWRTWPAHVAPVVSLHRDQAVAVARTLAAELGAGNVVHFEVDPHRSAKPQVDGLVSAWDQLRSALASAIMADAEYRGAVDEVAIARAEAAMQLRFPPAWRAYLRRPSWFYRGWMRSGAYIWLNAPEESAELVRSWAGFGEYAGMVSIGGNAGLEVLTIDARDPETAVTLTPQIGSGWADSIVQCRTVDELVEAVEAGTFEFTFGDD